MPFPDLIASVIERRSEANHLLGFPHTMHRVRPSTSADERLAEVAAYRPGVLRDQ